MSIIEIYVKNRFQQLFGSIIIPVTPEYIQYQLLLLSIHQMPPSIAHRALTAAVLQTFKYRTELFFTNNFMTSHPWT